MRAIIIEDEQAAARSLEKMLSAEYPQMEVLTTLQGVDESILWLREHGMPDLIFMDIHLSDGSSFSIFKEIDITCPVIFTTAYDEYALKAFEVTSIDYLLKPIDPNDLNRAVNKFLKLKGTDKNFEARLKDLLDSVHSRGKAYRSSFLISERDKLIPLAVNEIAYISIDLKIVTAVTFDGKKRYLDQTLDDLSSQLDPALFYRANRQYIISRSSIKELATWFGSKLAVTLTVPTPDRVFISKEKVRAFKNWLQEGI